MTRGLGSCCFALAVLVCGACEGKEFPPTAPPPPVATVSLRVEGRVIDAEGEEPVAGALITAHWVRRAGGLTHPVSDASDSADDKGVFGLTANLPEDWRELALRVGRDDYDRTEVKVTPSATTSAVLRLYRTLTIGPGESIDTRVFLDSYVHGFEFGNDSFLGRRVTVTSPSSGELIDLEVAATDSDVGLVGEDTSFFLGFQRRLTVSEGRTVVIIVPSPAKVTLTARRH